MKVPWGSNDWNRVLVYGLGLSGVAAAKLLRSRGVEVIGVDQRGLGALDLDDLLSDPGVSIRAGGEPEELPEGLDGVVMSPGVPLDRPLVAAARRQGLPVIAEVELGFALASGRVIGITGSNGKSTTTALAGALLEASGFDVRVCGNIGVPLSACLDGSGETVFATELSSFQLEAVDTFRPQAAALLNLSEDHLDRYRSFSDYVAAKTHLFDKQEETDVAVLNADDPQVAATVVRARRRLFSRKGPVKDGCYVREGAVVETTPGSKDLELFQCDDLSLPGLHNLENAMAAALVSRALGADPRGWGQVLRSFQGLPHRLERVRELGGAVWYDDSKGTNVAAAMKSIEGFEDGTVHLILGGRHKGDDLGLLTSLVRRKARRLYLVGEAADGIRRILGSEAHFEMAGDLPTAVASAAGRVKAGEIVLLSPACASFDQYDNFAERGDHFKRLVRSLDG